MRRKRIGILSFLWIIFLSVLAVFCLFPFVFAFYSSLQHPGDYGHFVAPWKLTFENYIKVAQYAPLSQWYFNTIFVTSMVVLSNLFFSSMAGYALARFSFPGKNTMLLFILGTMVLPVQVYLIPLYFLIARLNWQNTYQALIFPISVFPFCVFLMRQYFLTLPRELEDAAKIDGLGDFGIFFRIALPLSKPALATQVILSFTWAWNGFVIPLTMTTDPSYFTLPVGLNSLKDLYFDWPTINMAGFIYTTFPVIAVFIAFQKHIIQAFVTAGIKG